MRIYDNRVMHKIWLFLSFDIFNWPYLGGHYCMATSITPSMVRSTIKFYNLTIINKYNTFFFYRMWFLWNERLQASETIYLMLEINTDELYRKWHRGRQTLEDVPDFESTFGISVDQGITKKFSAAGRPFVNKFSAAKSRCFLDNSAVFLR